jgi:hypothetical protein
LTAESADPVVHDGGHKSPSTTTGILVLRGFSSYRGMGDGSPTLSATDPEQNVDMIGVFLKSAGVVPKAVPKTGCALNVLPKSDRRGCAL